MAISIILSSLYRNCPLTFNSFVYLFSTSYFVIVSLSNFCCEHSLVDVLSETDILSSFLPSLLTCLLACFLVCLLACLFAWLLGCWLAGWLAGWLARLLACLLACLLAYLLTYLLTYSRLLRARSSLTFRKLWSVDSLQNAYVTWQEHTVCKKFI